MAGVMTPSPKKIAVPKMPSSSSRVRSAGRSFTAWVARASMAIKPPSPWLSARRINATYFSETTTVNVQNTSDKMPRMLSGVSGTRPWAKTSFSAYSGLVPMSPYTTPMAASVSAAVAPGVRGRASAVMDAAGGLCACSPQILLRRSKKAADAQRRFTRRPLRRGP